MDERSRRIEARFELPLVIAALLVIPVVIIDEGNYGPAWQTVGQVLNWLTWLVFVAEGAVMLYVVPDRWRWLRDHPIDVAVIVLTPPFLASLASGRVVRLFRLIRLLRLGPAARRLFSTRGLEYTAALAALTAITGGAAFSSVQPGASLGQGLFWSLSTMTTVGYSDLTPSTAGGKAIAVVVMLVGIGFVAVLTGAIAQHFVAVEAEEETAEIEAQAEAEVDEASAAILRELRELQTRLAGMERTIRRHFG